MLAAMIPDPILKAFYFQETPTKRYPEAKESPGAPGRLSSRQPNNGAEAAWTADLYVEPPGAADTGILGRHIESFNLNVHHDLILLVLFKFCLKRGREIASLALKLSLFETLSARYRCRKRFSVQICLPELSRITTRLEEIIGAPPRPVQKTCLLWTPYCYAGSTKVFSSFASFNLAFA